MASGLGRRFGGNKLMAELIDKPLIKWILDTTEGLFSKRVVVTRNDEVKKLCEANGIACIFHELPHRNDTVRIGLSSMLNEIDYCFFTPGDQPLISRESIVALLNEAMESEKIVRPVYEDMVGAPVGFPQIYFEELLTLPEGKGGNWVVKKHPEAVNLVEVKSRYELLDVDTVSDLATIQQLLNS